MSSDTADLVKRLWTQPPIYGGTTQALREEAAVAIERLDRTLMVVAGNLGCGPANLISWSEKVGAALIELDRLKQRKKP